MKYQVLAICALLMNASALKLHQKSALKDDDSDLSVSALAKEAGTELSQAEMEEIQAQAQAAAQAQSGQSDAAPAAPAGGMGGGLAALLGGGAPAAAPAAPAEAADPSAKIADMASKLGVEVTPELLSLGSVDAMQNKLVEIAVGQGKSEDEIVKAMG